MAKDKLWEKAKKDFPCDPALCEIHYARLKIQEQTKGVSDGEYIGFIKMKAKKLLKNDSIRHIATDIKKIKSGKELQKSKIKIGIMLKEEDLW